MHVIGEIIVIIRLAEADAALLAGLGHGPRMVACGDLVGGTVLAGLDRRAPDAPGRGGLSWRRDPFFGRHGAIGLVARPVVESGARRSGRDLRLLLVSLAFVELVEVRDDLARLRELLDLDLAAADQIQHDLTELREGLTPPATGECVIEPRPAFARAALESGA